MDHENTSVTLKDIEKIRSQLFGKRFRKLMNKKNISRYRLAKESGLTSQTLYCWEMELYQPTMENALKVAKILKLI